MVDKAVGERSLHEGEGHRQSRSRSPFRLAALLAAALILGLSWSLASAPASSPDDDFHLASIWCAWGTEASECQVIETPRGREHLVVHVAPLSQHISDCMAFQPEVSGSCILPSTGGTGADIAARPWPARANNGAYPAGYYATQRLLVADSVEMSLIAMRMANFAVCLALLVASAAFLRGADRWRLLLSWLVVSVPLGLFLYASTNPSGVAIAAVGATFAATLAALVASDRRSASCSTALACVAVVVGSQSRPDTLYYGAIAVVAGALASEAWRPGGRRHALLVALPLVATLALTGLIRDTGLASSLTAQPAAGGPSIAFNLVRVPLLYLGDFATSLGWLDTHMPVAVWGSIALAILGLALLGLRSMTVGRWAALAMLLTACVVIPLVMLNQAGARVWDEVQPRYLLPLVMIVAGVLAFVPGSPPVGPPRLPWLAVAGLATLSNSIAIHTTLRRYLTGTDVSAWNLDANR